MVHPTLKCIVVRAWCERYFLDVWSSRRLKGSDGGYAVVEAESPVTGAFLLVDPDAPCVAAWVPCNARVREYNGQLVVVSTYKLAWSACVQAGVYRQIVRLAQQTEQPVPVLTVEPDPVQETAACPETGLVLVEPELAHVWYRLMREWVDGKYHPCFRRYDNTVRISFDQGDVEG